MPPSCQRGIILFGMIAVLFVVLCPLTPTPSAVLKSVHAAGPLLVIPAFSAPLGNSVRFTAEFLAVAPPVPVRELSCVRLI
jgi:hypothetical protein